MTATTLSNTSRNNLLEQATTYVAASAVASPVWLPWLQDASQVAGALAPILGAIWLLVQIWAKVSEMRRRNRND